jgi:phosphatidylserine synthase
VFDVVEFKVLPALFLAVVGRKGFVLVFGNVFFCCAAGTVCEHQLL